MSRTFGSRLRALVVVLGVCVSVGALALESTPALAALQHPYVSQLTGAPLTAPVPGPFTGPYGVTVDGSDNVWVADAGPGLMDRFDSSGNFLAQGTGAGHWTGGNTLSVAFSNASGHLYVADSNNDDVWVLNADGSYNSDIPGSNATWGSGCCYVFTAADNSAGATGGDVYVSSNGGTVTRIDGAGSPANFSGSAAYINANQLTGTPSHSFGRLQGVSVDSSGNVYVVDPSHDVIDEFDSTGVFVRELGETPDGPFAGVEAVGVDPSSGHVYVLDGSSKLVDEFDSSGTYLGQIVGPDTPAHSLGSPRGVAVNSKGDIYITDAAHAVVDIFGPAFVVDGEFTSNVAATSATLEAQINPLGVHTTAYLQYGTLRCTTSQASCTDVPLPPGTDIGSAESDQLVSAHVQSLTPDTTYHYRVVAVRELAPGQFEAIDGPDETFVTEPAVSAFALPDGRAWEMVSPPDKQGAGLESVPVLEGGLAQAAVDGGAIAYIANGPTEERPLGSPTPEAIQLVSSRGTAGWATKMIATAHDGPSGLVAGHLSEYKLFSPDLSLAAVEPKGHTLLSEDTSERTPYLRHDTTCEASPATCYQPLVNAANVAHGTKFGGDPSHSIGEILFEGASPDLRHVILTSRVPLMSTSVEGTLYEWVGGALQPVSVLPANEGGAVVAGELGVFQQNVRHAVSGDGSRVIWKSSFLKGLYLRDVVRDESVRLDVPESGAAGGRKEPIFQTASSDASRVFFTDEARLTVDSNASEGKADLYEFNTETGKLTDLTVDPNTGESADVQGVVQGVSEDGSYVYFVATGALASGATRGSDNLYVRHGGITTLVATLSPDDGESSSSYGTFAGQLAHMTARVSPNGRWLAFMSDVSLTGYDNRDANSGVRDEEVFLYDATVNRLVCASCNPTGARPGGTFDRADNVTSTKSLFDRSDLWNERWVASAVPGWTFTSIGAAIYQSRYLSDSGRLFFDSSDALTPRDTNGTVDVYEYEPEVVVGSDCTHASATFDKTADGCVGLLSSGGSAEESVFMDASENGNDAFFLTSSQLAPQDIDHSLDLYDARVCSVSSPCLAVPPAVPPPCSTGDSCKAAPSLQPESFGAPSSETFSGAGNVSGSAANASVHAKSLTRGQKLTRAVRSCRKKKAKRKRAACERQARRLYAKRVAGKSAASMSLSARTGR